VAIHESGAARIFTLINDTLWKISESVETDVPANPLQEGIFVLEAKSGSECRANNARLVAAMRSAVPEEGGHVWAIFAGATGARCNVDLIGDRIAKAEWGSSVNIQTVQVVEKLGMCTRCTTFFHSNIFP
jgi:hypothetical protein